MLPEHDRERLERIEQELHAEDPEFASRFQDPHRFRPRDWFTRARALGVLASAAALLCLVLGQGLGFTAAAFLAVALFAVHGWNIRAE